MRVWGRAGFGAVAMGVALGCSIVVSELVDNRYLTIDGAKRDAGWSATLDSPDVVLLVPLYLLLAALICQQLGRSRPVLSFASSLPQRDR